MASRQPGSSGSKEIFLTQTSPLRRQTVFSDLNESSRLSESNARGQEFFQYRLLSKVTARASTGKRKSSEGKTKLEDMPSKGQSL